MLSSAAMIPKMMLTVMSLEIDMIAWNLDSREDASFKNDDSWAAYL